MLKQVQDSLTEGRNFRINHLSLPR
jgi:hypothetical protein